MPFRLTGVLFCLLALVLGCRATPTPTRAPVTIRLGGSDSLAPLAAELGALYEESHPYAHILVSPTNSETGLREFAMGSLDLAFVSRNPGADELARRPAHALEIGRDGLLIVVNAANPLQGATREQIAMIFAGEIVNWSELKIKPPNGGDAIEVLSREAGSGTRVSFEDLLMPGRRVTLAALIRTNERDVLAYVSSHAGAVGYSAFTSFNTDSGTHALTVDGIAPSLETIRSEKYPLMRTYYLIVPEDLSPDLAQFMDFLQSQVARRIISQKLSVSTPAP